MDKHNILGVIFLSILIFFFGAAQILNAQEGDKSGSEYEIWSPDGTGVTPSSFSTIFAPNLTINKTANPGTASQGDAVDFTISLNNAAGDQTAGIQSNPLTVSDPFPYVFSGAACSRTSNELIQTVTASDLFNCVDAGTGAPRSPFTAGIDGGENSSGAVTCNFTVSGSGSIDGWDVYAAWTSFGSSWLSEFQIRLDNPNSVSDPDVFWNPGYGEDYADSGVMHTAGVSGINLGYLSGLPANGTWEIHFYESYSDSSSPDSVLNDFAFSFFERRTTPLPVGDLNDSNVHLQGGASGYGADTTAVYTCATTVDATCYDGNAINTATESLTGGSDATSVYVTGNIAAITVSSVGETSTPNNGTHYEPGETVTFDVEVVNSGDVALEGPINITSDITSCDWSCGTSSIAGPIGVSGTGTAAVSCTANQGGTPQSCSVAFVATAPEITTMLTNAGTNAHAACAASDTSGISVPLAVTLSTFSAMPSNQVGWLSVVLVGLMTLTGSIFSWRNGRRKK